MDKRDDDERTEHVARELARRLAMIEDRPEMTLLWSDVGHHARTLWRRLGAVSRRRR
jgi:hypothetical protein